MRALVQRVSRASVEIGGATIAEIGAGALVFVCAMVGDDAATAAKVARKIARLRIFKDDDGRMNRALLDTGGAALVVSQFTLGADLRGGNRPGFSGVASPDEARALYERCAAALQELGVSVAMGRFGADMTVALVNDGPVTIWLDV